MSYKSATTIKNLALIFLPRTNDFAGSYENVT